MGSIPNPSIERETEVEKIASLSKIKNRWLAFVSAHGVITVAAAGIPPEPGDETPEKVPSLSAGALLLLTGGLLLGTFAIGRGRVQA